MGSREVKTLATQSQKVLALFYAAFFCTLFVCFLTLINQTQGNIRPMGREIKPTIQNRMYNIGELGHFQAQNLHTRILLFHLLYKRCSFAMCFHMGSGKPLR